MKQYRKITLAGFIALLCFYTTLAAGFDREQIRDVATFRAIKVSSSIELKIKMAGKQEVRVVADDDDIDRVQTTVKDGVLFLSFKSKRSWFSWGSHGHCTVYVSTPELEELHVSSGAEAESINTLKADRMKISVSSGADADLDIFVKELSIHTSSGSDARLTGKVKILHASASSGSDLRADALSSKICFASASSGSDITVNVSDELTASASSGGDIRYSGSPQKVQIDESSGGDVSGK